MMSSACRVRCPIAWDHDGGAASRPSQAGESVDRAEVSDQAFGGFPDDWKYLTDVVAVRACDSIGGGNHHSGNELQPNPAVDIELIGNAVTRFLAGVEIGLRIAELKINYETSTRITSPATAIRFCLHQFGRMARESQQEEF